MISGGPFQSRSRRSTLKLIAICLVCDRMRSSATEVHDKTSFTDTATLRHDLLDTGSKSHVRKTLRIRDSSQLRPSWRRCREFKYLQNSEHKSRTGHSPTLKILQSSRTSSRPESPAMFRSFSNPVLMIWRVRSRDTPRRSPICSSVIG